MGKGEEKQGICPLFNKKERITRDERNKFLFTMRGGKGILFPPPLLLLLRLNKVVLPPWEFS